MKSKQQTTFPFWTSTCGGGWAYLQSSSLLGQASLENSRQTSSVSHLESFPGFNRMAATLGELSTGSMFSISNESKGPIQICQKLFLVCITCNSNSLFQIRKWEVNNFFFYILFLFSLLFPETRTNMLKLQ